MDEVDGMAGNEDRGGVAELIGSVMLGINRGYFTLMFALITG